MFDTGAETMVINQDILEKKLTMNFDSEVTNIGTNGVSKVPVSSKNKFSFGGLLNDNISFVAVPYGDPPFDGVMGSTFMKRYIIEIDYKKKKMSFYDPNTYKFNIKGYDELDIEFSTGVPLINASVIIDGDKYMGKYEMDTGSDGGLMMSAPFTDEHDLTHKLKTVAHANSLGSDGTKSASPIVVIPEIGIAEKHFYLIPAILSTAKSGVSADKKIAGMFGNNFFKRFDMIIDMAGNKTFIKPNNLVHTPYYDFLVK
jgi:hypothetical protein